MTPSVKVCAGCKQSKPFTQFHGDGKGRVHRRFCSDCENQRRRDVKVIADIRQGGEVLAAFGSPLERVCAEQLIVAGSVHAAAVQTGVSPDVLRAHLSELRRKAAARGFSPGNDMTKTTPDGYHVKGVSTLYDGDGKVSAQWVKTSRDDEHKLAMLLDAMSSVSSSWSGRNAARSTPAPKRTDRELLAVYPLGDPHFGMFSWGEETGGEDFDLKVAEERTCSAIDQLVVSSPAAQKFILCSVGDTAHGDNTSNQTSRSGHSLDVDTRWGKIMRVIIRSIRRAADRALEKHASGEIIIVPGNHDDHSSVMIALCLAQFYEREPRIKVNTSPDPFLWHRHGKCLLGFVHGHMTKMADLPQIMACDRAQDWAETEHRHWYTGHVHHDAHKDFRGCSAESLRILAPRDAWHHQKGYRSMQDMKCDTWHERWGRIQRNIVSVAQIKEQTA